MLLAAAYLRLMLLSAGFPLTVGASCFSDLDCTVGLCCSSFDLCTSALSICPSFASTPAPTPFRSNTPSNSTSHGNSGGTSSSGGGGGSSNIGAIAGGAAGGAIAVTAVLVFLWCRFRQRTPSPPASSKQVHLYTILQAQFHAIAATRGWQLKHSEPQQYQNHRA
jgi:hypothetical protein